MIRPIEMMMRRMRGRVGSPYGLAVGVALGIANVMPAHAEVLNAMVSIECDILTRAVTGGTEFSGIVRSQSQVAGDYSFIVASSGAGGTSSVIQRGLFQLGKEHEAMVGQIVIGSGARTQVTARLTIRTEYDDLVCNAIK